ncbi:AcrB/AcrD/AcrF family protein [Sesbania bispinosa]|nr:AcrB/AcrD/AcrF family protein [Sesbania bispinosa]
MAESSKCSRFAMESSHGCCSWYLTAGKEEQPYDHEPEQPRGRRGMRGGGKVPEKEGAMANVEGVRR